MAPMQEKKKGWSMEGEKTVEEGTVHTQTCEGCHRGRKIQRGWVELAK